MEKKYYTDEKNAQIVIALLKAHGIRKIVANPGTTNMALVGSVQSDPWFEVFSGVDERHSAYMAVGMAAESGEPVVLSCTGATASRNYLPALTEAYYRKLPILAITSMQNLDNAGQLIPQFLDRSEAPADTARRRFECRLVKDDEDRRVCVRKVNEAILELRRQGGGPVHINLETAYCMAYNTKELPRVKKINRFDVATLDDAPAIGKGAKVAVFVGSGHCSARWSEFAKSHNCAIFADLGSAYRGGDAIASSLLCSQQGFRINPKFAALKPDLVIFIGEVSGDYPSFRFLSGIAPVWRVSPDGELRSCLGTPDCVFEMPEDCFIDHYCQASAEAASTYRDAWVKCDTDIRANIPDLPFANPWMAQNLSDKLPNGCVVHLGILNSLRSWNLFPPNASIAAYSNVGGFGIDGGVSTLIGASLASRDKLFFGMFGDLAFFYDLNSLGNRAIGGNVRILLINNGCGAEFNMYFHPGSQFGEHANDFIAAGRHFGNKSQGLVRDFAQNLGFKYLSASTKGEYLAKLPEFLSENRETPIIFECFTNVADESEAHRRLEHIDPYVDACNGKLATMVKGMLPTSVKDAIKGVLR